MFHSLLAFSLLKILEIPKADSGKPVELAVCFKTGRGKQGWRGRLTPALSTPHS